MQVLERKILNEAVQRIVSALLPERIYLYGSHAYGQPHPDSDVDLLIVVGNSSIPITLTTIAAYRALRGLRIPAEIKVVLSEEFSRRTKWINSIERTVIEKGELLYDTPGGRSSRMVTEGRTRPVIGKNFDASQASRSGDGLLSLPTIGGEDD